MRPRLLLGCLAGAPLHRHLTNSHCRHRPCCRGHPCPYFPCPALPCHGCLRLPCPCPCPLTCFWLHVGQHLLHWQLQFQLFCAPSICDVCHGYEGGGVPASPLRRQHPQHHALHNSGRRAGAGGKNKLMCRAAIRDASACPACALRQLTWCRPAQRCASGRSSPGRSTSLLPSLALLAIVAKL